MNIRLGTLSDFSKIIQIENQVFKNSSWHYTHLREELISGNDRRTLVIEDFEVIIGYLMVRKFENQIDILNLNQIKKCIDKYKPDIFIHLAAVSRPMAIHDEDISHSIETNIIGTANVVKACSEIFGVPL